MSVLEDVKNQIKEEVTMTDVIEKLYNREINSEGKVLCDFHEDSSASMHIYPDGYHCFTCEAHGDIINYVQHIENNSFREALEILGELGGIEVPEYKPDPEKEKLKAIVTEKNRVFYKTLMDDPDALQYLKERGIGETEITKWRLGMIPWNWANRLYAGRIVFGMTEVHYKPDQAKTIAMGYRIRNMEDYKKHGFSQEDIDKYLNPKYDDERNILKIGPKYINDSTKNNPIYDKSNYLYGLNQARKSIRERKYAVIMEGYTDVIMAHKSGLDVAVASCGTSVTEEQVMLLRKYCSKIYLWLDGDNAGKDAVARALPKFLKHGFEVLIVQSPVGLDPADIVMQGHDLTHYIAANAKQAVQLVINNTLEDYDKMVNNARIKALDSVLPLIENMSNISHQANYRAVLENRLNVRL